MPKKAPDKADWKFVGFAFPNTTPIPDQVFDELLTVLSGAELKVLLYICRRTFGFKRESDNIALSQMLTGIVTKDGRRLDHGVGLSKPTLLKALRSLKEMNIIVAERRQSEKRGDEPTSYSLNIVNPSLQHGQHPVVKKVNQGVVKEVNPPVDKKVDQAVVKKSTPQQTVLQETVIQQQSPSKPDGNNNSSSEVTRHNEDVVVVALIGLGISQKVAKRLEQRYSPKRINEKIDFLEFIQEESPEKIANPRGWLRKAIEEDYGAPDGYRTKEERLREKQELQQQKEEEDAWRKELSLLKKDEDAQRHQRMEQALLSAQNEYGTTPEDTKMWQEVQENLRYSLPATTATLIENTHLLSSKNGAAIVGTTNSFAADRLQGRISSRLQNELNRLGSEVEAIEFVLIEVEK